MLARLATLIGRIPPDFGRTRPAVHYWIFGPLLALQLYTSHLSVPLMALGVFSWTLIEYVLHRFSFHSESDHALVQPFNSGLHLLHHQAPRDAKYVAAPILLALFVYASVFAMFRFVFGMNVALNLGSGVLIGFLYYEWVHHMAHFGYPKFVLFKYLKRHHMKHHFTTEQKLFGVTSPLWDKVFNTFELEE